MIICKRDGKKTHSLRDSAAKSELFKTAESYLQRVPYLPGGKP